MTAIPSRPPFPRPHFLLAGRLLAGHPVACRVLAGRLLAGLLLAGLFLAGLFPGLRAAPAAAQVELPPDTYSDAGVRALLDRAREAREGVVEGLESYDGTLWERVHVGLSMARFRRERGLFHQERAARIRWSADGNHVVRWDGARRDIPLAGLSSTEEPEGDAAGGDEALRGMAADLARELARGASLPPPLRFDPGSDRIVFQIGGSGGGGSAWALHPLADTAGLHYRFRSGDTLRVTLPERERPVTLAEVRVEPRRAAFELLAASLWFDLETGTLVRATYRPSRNFNLELDGPEDARNVPRVLRPVEVEIRYITVDHGLFDFRWWIPRRFAFEGELRAGAFLRVPARFEWTVSGLVANARPDPSVFPEEAPPGWTLTQVRERTDEEGNVVSSVRVLVPPPSHLALHPALSAPDDRDGAAFTPDELRELERGIRGLMPSWDRFAPRYSWGLAEGMTRYNRVEGLSTGVAAMLPLKGDLRLSTEARIGIADLEPNGEVHLKWGTPGRGGEVGAYRRLVSASEWAPGHTLAHSLSTFLWGSDRTPFYRALGGELALTRDGRSSLREARLFAEAHRSARRGTHMHLRRAFNGDTLALNPPADRGAWLGAELRHRWQTGVDPQRVRLFTNLRVEGAAGTSAYGRAWGGLGLTVPLGGRVTGGIEGAAGATVGRPPDQRLFHPGGPSGFRGAAGGERRGEGFWLARAELAVGRPFGRVALFGDLLRVGPRDEVFRAGQPELAVGTGLSFLDGLFRVDVARGIRGPERWRIHAYLDGIL